VVRTLAFPLFLDTLTDLTDMDVLVLSCYDSPDVQAGLDKLRRQGNQVTLHLLERMPTTDERGGTLCG
jgi:aryl carrier-like protein